MPGKTAILERRLGGALGKRAVKEAGDLVFVQEPTPSTR
jgi:hypothetical protein